MMSTASFHIQQNDTVKYAQQGLHRDSDNSGWVSVGMSGANDLTIHASLEQLRRFSDVFAAAVLALEDQANEKAGKPFSAEPISVNDLESVNFPV